MPAASISIEIPLIVIDARFFEKLDEFLPERPGPVMFFLAGDVGSHGVLGGGADGEGGVTFLPMKPRLMGMVPEP